MAEEDRKRIEFLGEDFHAEITYQDKYKILVSFRQNHVGDELKESNIGKILEDLNDLGKWRIFKKLKKDLES